MTEEKKKPEDEVSEEELENVAGGLTVSANSAEVQSQSKPPPDVCMVPPPPAPFVPAPYPTKGKPDSPDE